MGHFLKLTAILNMFALLKSNWLKVLLQILNNRPAFPMSLLGYLIDQNHPIQPQCYDSKIMAPPPKYAMKCEAGGGGERDEVMLLLMPPLFPCL